ncbi:MAG TPA: MFS transporter [Acidobacteriaceae bacterium]|jgi:MFS family permease|nr:MFS transporter [Acidobacteriaceae bacterium]
MNNSQARVVRYRRLLLAFSGLGGLLYGADIGIIAAALLYLSHTIDLTIAQTSLVVAAVLGGSMFSSLAAGMLADWVGRRKMTIVSGLMFIVSIVIIVLSHGFTGLFTGRLLQGMSGGVIAVVVPLYLAECLPANERGRGTGFFQFMLTFGIVLAAFIGWLYTRHAETVIAHAAGNAVLIEAAQNHAWRGMFLTVIYPGILFFISCFFLSETPRWLFRKGRIAEARTALLRGLPEQEADVVWQEMEDVAREEKVATDTGAHDSLWRRKYVVPFVLACIVLALTQTTGINSILSFLVIILRQAGMGARHATQGDVVVKVLNSVMTLVAVALVDRRGRRFLLRIGTGGVVVALLAAGLIFYSIETRTSDVRSTLQSAVSGDSLTLPLSSATLPAETAGRPTSLTVVYSYGDGDHMDTVLSDTPDPVVHVTPDPQEAGKPLIIRRARYGLIPVPGIGWAVAGCLALFILGYAFGPGVVVWLILSELMPTRIRSTGMGVAMLINQGISTAIAALFLPVVGIFGYYAMFFFWAGCTFLYFLTATFLLPETKGRTLEEIEKYFEGGGKQAAVAGGGSLS